MNDYDALLDAAERDMAMLASPRKPARPAPAAEPELPANNYDELLDQAHRDLGLMPSAAPSSAADAPVQDDPSERSDAGAADRARAIAEWAGRTGVRLPEAIARQIPFVGSGIDALTTGKNPYSGWEGGARLAGDIGGAAGAVASGSRLAIRAGLGMAGVDATGLADRLRQMSKYLQEKTDDVFATDEASEGDWGGMKNVLSRLPGMGVGIAGDVLPYLLAGKAIAKVSGQPQPGVDQAAGRRVSELAAKHEIPVTQAMVEGPNSAAAMRQKALESNPSTAGVAAEAFHRLQQAQKRALGRSAERNFGDTALAGELEGAPGQRPVFNPERLVGSLPDELKGLIDTAGSQVGAAWERIRAAQRRSTPSLGNKMAGAVAEQGRRVGLEPEDLGTVGRINRQGLNKAASDLAAETLSEARLVRSADSGKKLLSTFDRAIDELFREGKLASRSDRFLVGVRRGLNDAIMAQVKKADPKGYLKLKKANKEYSETRSAAEPLYESTFKAGQKGADAILDQLLSGQESYAGMNKAFAKQPEVMKRVRGAVFQRLVRDSLDADSRPSAAKLENAVQAIAKKKPEVWKEIMGDEGFARDLGEFRELFKAIDESRQPLGTNLKGGAQTAPLLQILGRWTGAKASLGTIGESQWFKGPKDYWQRREAGKAFQPYSPPKLKAQLTAKQLRDRSRLLALSESAREAGQETK